MIIAIVRFSLPQPLSPAQAGSAFAGSAPSYQHIPGLRHKQYLLSDDGTVAGGIYQWDSREQAEALYNDDWRARIMDRYGAAPTVEYFTSPVQVSPEKVTVVTVETG